jgi:hypothetical protein
MEEYALYAFGHGSPQIFFFSFGSNFYVHGSIYMNDASISLFLYILGLTYNLKGVRDLKGTF